MDPLERLELKLIRMHNAAVETLAIQLYESAIRYEGGRDDWLNAAPSSRLRYRQIARDFMDEGRDYSA